MVERVHCVFLYSFVSLCFDVGGDYTTAGTVIRFYLKQFKIFLFFYPFPEEFESPLHWIYVALIENHCCRHSYVLLNGYFFIFQDLPTTFKLPPKLRPWQHCGQALSPADQTL